jgi:hypothetical protein
MNGICECINGFGGITCLSCEFFLISIYKFNIKSLLDGLSASLILSFQEQTSLVNMTDYSNGTLLYRGSRDGFTNKAFHEKCDGKANAVIIIKTNKDYVFGGYASAKWTSERNFISDSNAFIFSIRRNGISNGLKFMVKLPERALDSGADYGPVFGYHDIVVKGESNINRKSYANFFQKTETDRSYHFPAELLASSNEWFLAGENNFQTTEIEVYQITEFSISESFLISTATFFCL